MFVRVCLCECFISRREKADEDRDNSSRSFPLDRPCVMSRDQNYNNNTYILELHFLSNQEKYHDVRKIK